MMDLLVVSSGSVSVLEPPIASCRDAAESRLPCGGDDPGGVDQHNPRTSPGHRQRCGAIDHVPRRVAGSAWFTAPVEVSRSRAALRSAIPIAPIAVVQI